MLLLGDALKGNTASPVLEHYSKHVYFMPISKEIALAHALCEGIGQSPLQRLRFFRVLPSTEREVLLTELGKF